MFSLFMQKKKKRWFSLPKFHYIGIGFALSIFGVVLVGVLSYWQIQKLMYDNVVSYQALRNTQTQFQKLRNSIGSTIFLLQNRLIETEPATDESRKRIWKQDIQSSLDTLKNLQKTWLNPDLRMKYETFLIQIRKFELSQSETAEILRQSLIPEYDQTNTIKELLKENTPVQIFKDQILEIVPIINTQLDNLQDFLKQEFQEKNLQTQYGVQQFWAIETMLFLLLIILLILIGMRIGQTQRYNITQIERYTRAFALGNLPEKIELRHEETNEILQNLQALSKGLSQVKTFASKVSEGSFGEGEVIFEGEGELGTALAQMHEGLQNVAVRDRQRNWINEGLALFGNVLREYSNAEVLYNQVIVTLVKYVNATQGAIFVLNDRQNPPTLDLKSLYAFDRQRFLEKSIKPGQGLIGQAWLEKDIIHLEHSSEDFVQITSGLGGATPRSVLIVPMINTELQVLGMFELASFQPFLEYQIDFVKRIGEMMVAAVSALKNTEKTKLLLEDAQRNTLRMNVQEQEMRQNLSQLSNAKEDVLRVQAQFNALYGAIGQLMGYAEFELQDTIIFANNIFLDAIRYNLGEIKGKSAKLLYNPKALKPTDYQKFWQALREGHAQFQEIRLQSKDGQEIWFIGTFFPARNHKNEIEKVIMLATEITTYKNTEYQSAKRLNVFNQLYAIVEYDMSGNMIDGNDKYLRLIGYSLNEIKDKPHDWLTPSQTPSSLTNDVWERLEQGETMLGNFDFFAKNGQLIKFSGTFVPVINSNGRTKSVLGILQYS